MSFSVEYLMGMDVSVLEEGEFVLRNGFNTTQL